MGYVVCPKCHCGLAHQIGLNFIVCPSCKSKFKLILEEIKEVKRKA